MLRKHILATHEGLRASGLPVVNPRGQHKESGGDSKAIEVTKKFCDGHRTNGQTVVLVEIVMY